MYANLSLDYQVFKDIVEKTIKPEQRRGLAEQAMAEQGISERRPRRILELSQSAYRCRAKRIDDQRIERELQRLANSQPR